MTSESPPELTRSEKWFTMVGTLLGMLLAALDQTIVATAGPAIQSDLHIEASLYAWITTVYLLTSTVMVPIYGKLSDLFGRKRILITGILIFLAGSVLCGIARSTWQLLAFRAVQGIGAAALFTSAFAVVADIYPPAVRSKYQGIMGGAWAVSSVVGPLAGGFLTDQLGWHWVFFVNLPIGGIALAFIALRMPTLRRLPAERLPLDIAGALALALAVVPLLLALSLGKHRVAPGITGYEWGSPPIIGLFALSSAGLALFLIAELRARDPLLDIRLFRNRTFAVGNLASFVVGMGFLGAIVFLPLFMVQVVGLSATHSGLTVVPLTLGIVSGNLMAGQLVSRLGRYKIVLQGSLVLLTIGYAFMGFTLAPDSTRTEITIKMILVGLGLGPGIVVFTVAVQNSVGPERVGVATAAATFCRALGSVAGLAILGTVFGSALVSSVERRMGDDAADLPPAIRAQLGHDVASEAPPPGAAAVSRDPRFRLAFTEAIARVYQVAIAFSVLGFVVVLFLPQLPLRRTHGPGPPPDQGQRSKDSVRPAGSGAGRRAPRRRTGDRPSSR